MAFILYHGVKWTESKAWMKKLLENIFSSNLSTVSAVFLPHQCFDKSFSPTESYSSFQRLVWCPHFAFCCSYKILTLLLSFQCCRFQQLGVRGSMSQRSPRGEWSKDFSLSPLRNKLLTLQQQHSCFLRTFCFSPTQKVAREESLQ